MSRSRNSRRGQIDGRNHDHYYERFTRDRAKKRDLRRVDEIAAALETNTPQSGDRASAAGFTLYLKRSGEPYTEGAR